MRVSPLVVTRWPLSHVRMCHLHWTGFQVTCQKHKTFVWFILDFLIQFFIYNEGIQFYRLMGCLNLSRGIFIFIIFVCKKSTLNKVQFKYFAWRILYGLCCFYGFRFLKSEFSGSSVHFYLQLVSWYKHYFYVLDSNKYNYLKAAPPESMR